MIRLYLSKCSYAIMLLLAASSMALAQQVVSGKVTSSDDNSAIPGVNVIEKGTSNGTVTDGDGSFKISVGANATLVFSFVGYASQEVVVGSQSQIAVSLASDVVSLSEVVVIGYGSQEKKEITGAVTAVDIKDFNKGNVNDPTQLLQGKVAGLSIYNKGGDPNSSAVIRLRGLSTIGSNQSPLIVVDGVLGASLDNVDPNDIASINVLKDGSAAAIYGSRGSSGVILVTTKRGAKGGGLNVSFNTYVAAQTIFKTVPVMSADQYVAAGGNNLGSKTDWQDEVTRTGITNVNNLAISGSTQNTSFRLSSNFRNINGILKKSGFDQINTRANLTHSALDNKLKFDLNMSFTNRNQNFSFPEALRYAALYNPTAPIRFASGDFYQAVLFDNFNPVAIIDQNTAKGTRKNLNYSAKVDYSIFKDLTLTVNLGQQYNNSTRDEYYASKSYYRGLNRNGLSRKNVDQDDFTLFEAYGNYAKQFGRFDLAASAGYSYQQQRNSGLFVELGNFPTDVLGGNQIQNSGDRLSGLPALTDISSYKTTSKIIAGFARVNLMFDNAIYLNASVRKEGSTKLGANNKWGTFPSVGAGVDINHYLKLANVSLLKFKAAYGVTGSLPSNTGLSQPNYGYEFDGGGAFVQNVDGNPDLKWEQKAETNIGLEFASGKFSGNLDVYQRKITNGILLIRRPAGVYPVQDQWQNQGALSTKGVELTLNYNAQIRDVSWTPGLVLSHYTTILDSYLGVDKVAKGDFGAPGQNGTNVNLLEVGKPIGQIYGPVFAGVEGNGAPRFADLNGDGTVISAPSEVLNPNADMKKLGTGIPTIEIGFTNRITYKNWDINIFFRSALGHSLVNQFRGFYEPIDPGAINSYNRISTSKAVSGLTSAQYSSLYVEKASFVKLDNMTIGYTFKTAASAYIKSIRVYGTGQNLFQITKYTGIDPDPVLQDLGSQENGGFAGAADPLVAGIDRRSNYFTARTFTLGLTFGF